MFPRIKKKLRDHHFGTLETVKEATTRCLKEVIVDAFQRAVSDWNWTRKESFFLDLFNLLLGQTL